MSKRKFSESLSGDENEDENPVHKQVNHEVVSSGDNEFNVLQAYRKFEKDLAQSKIETMRTGDINITMNNLEVIDSLFDKVNGKNNTSLYAHDSKAILNISELAEISVRYLKLGDTRSLVNIKDVLGFTKRYMLREYFDINQISETKNQALMTEEEDENENNIDIQQEEEDVTIRHDKLKKFTMQKQYLEQFDNYNQFHQFNWFKMGGLFNSLSKTPVTIDHLLSPFNAEQKLRNTGLRSRNKDTIGALTRPEDLTGKDLKETQETLTPEHVKNCFKILLKRNGYEKISLFEFILDPNSFPKSVENLFYTSFLIKEGKFVLEEDEENGFPTIRVKEPLPTNDSSLLEVEKQKRRDATQNHIIFQLDIPTWKTLVENFNITESYLASA